jgi:hypothetical protein
MREFSFGLVRFLGAVLLIAAAIALASYLNISP